MFIRYVKAYKKPLLFVLGLTFILTLLNQSDLPAVFHALRSIHMRYFALLLSLQLITIIAIAYQWQFIIKRYTINLSVFTLILMNLNGTFYEAITPAVKAGGEAYKVLYLKKYTHDVYRAAAMVTIQKSISLIGFLTLTLISLHFLTVMPALNNDAMILFGIIFGIVITLSLFMIVFRNKNTFLNSVVKAFTPFKTRKTELVLHYALSISIWLMFALKLGILLMAFNLDFPLTTILALTFIPYMVGLLPLSPGGLGTFETTLTLMLTSLGVAFTQALSITLIFRFITFWFPFVLSLLNIGVQSLKLKRRQINAKTSS